MGSLPVVNPIEDWFGRLHCPGGGGGFSHSRQISPSYIPTYQMTIAVTVDE